MALRRRRWGAVAELLGRVDDFAAEVAVALLRSRCYLASVLAS